MRPHFRWESSGSVRRRLIPALVYQDNATGPRISESIGGTSNRFSTYPPEYSVPSHTGYGGDVLWAIGMVFFTVA